MKPTAKHNDEELREAIDRAATSAEGEASISAAVFKANDGDYTGPTVSVAWAERFLAALGRSVAPREQHDALRLAAGRALELLRELRHSAPDVDPEQYACAKCRAHNYAPNLIVHSSHCELIKAITALSTALAGEQMGKE